MAMGKRRGETQGELWVATQNLPRSAGHPFYERLNAVLAEAGFEEFAQAQCRKFYAPTNGRPSMPPGVYFRALLVGYFEGLDSERGIAWRCEDSMALRRFLGYALDESTPDHSTISRTRRLVDLETHSAVFTWVLGVLAERGVVKGKTIGVDATTLEANAAMRSIVRRDTKESYEEFLRRLAKASGIETPTREDLARMDRKRKKRTSNAEWKNPHDPDARITQMKDGRTHLAYKAEHAVDLEEGAVVGVKIHGADEGDTSTLGATLGDAVERLDEVAKSAKAAEKIDEEPVSELVADKGYHSGAVLLNLEDNAVRSYIAEPGRGRRRWRRKQEEKNATYANRRRTRGSRGRALMRRRAEVVERGFAHSLETGAMRRVHLRGRDNVSKRYLLHVSALNLGLLMRALFGVGTPRALQGRLAAAAAALCGWIHALLALPTRPPDSRSLLSPLSATTEPSAAAA
jgi:transposase